MFTRLPTAVPHDIISLVNKAQRAVLNEGMHMHVQMICTYLGPVCDIMWLKDRSQIRQFPATRPHGDHAPAELQISVKQVYWHL